MVFKIFVIINVEKVTITPVFFFLMKKLDLCVTTHRFPMYLNYIYNKRTNLPYYSIIFTV